jgi:hypothetical protein
MNIPIEDHFTDKLEDILKKNITWEITYLQGSYRILVYDYQYAMKVFCRGDVPLVRGSGGSIEEAFEDCIVNACERVKL